jgi:tRNA pseudouridine32 synthase/23S rRNA pseudouridine746 synthase
MLAPLLHAALLHAHVAPLRRVATRAPVSRRWLAAAASLANSRAPPFPRAAADADDDADADDADAADAAALGARGAPLIAPTVVFEDADVLVVHKAAGRSYHAAAAAADPGVLGELRAMQADGRLGYGGTLHSVHRLDSPTSGLLLFAKSPAAQAAACAEFEKRRVDKFYVGVSARPPSKKEGSVLGDMEKGRRGCYRLLRSAANPAVTRFASRGLPSAERAGLRLLLFKPETGRTHQLRVAAKALGAPLVGDGRYEAKADAAVADRCYLHAAALRLWLPGRPAPICAIAPPTDGAHFSNNGAFRRIFEALFPAEMLGAPDARSAAERAAVEQLWTWPAARARLRASLAAGPAAAAAAEADAGASGSADRAEARQ